MIVLSRKLSQLTVLRSEFGESLRLLTGIRLLRCLSLQENRNIGGWRPLDRIWRLGALLFAPTGNIRLFNSSTAVNFHTHNTQLLTNRINEVNTNSKSLFNDIHRAVRNLRITNSQRHKQVQRIRQLTRNQQTHRHNFRFQHHSQLQSNSRLHRYASGQQHSSVLATHNQKPGIIQQYSSRDSAIYSNNHTEYRSIRLSITNRPNQRHLAGKFRSQMLFRLQASVLRGNHSQQSMPWSSSPAATIKQTHNSATTTLHNPAYVHRAMQTAAGLQDASTATTYRTKTLPTNKKKFPQWSVNERTVTRGVAHTRAFKSQTPVVCRASARPAQPRKADYRTRDQVIFRHHAVPDSVPVETRPVDVTNPNAETFIATRVLLLVNQRLEQWHKKRLSPKRLSAQITKALERNLVRERARLGV